MRNIKNISHFFTKRHPEFNFGYHNQALMGKLSASILHDILTPITTLSIGTTLQNSNNAKPILDTSMGQVREFVDLMKNFLSEHSMDSVLHINEEIRTSLKLMTHKALQNNIQIQFIEFDQVHSRAHALHIYQIVINLISNAIDASAASLTKKVILVLKKVGQTYVIECKDFGCGIHHNNLKKICTARFSTKPTGCGFGLYSTHFVVTQYLYGELTIHSEVEKGSLFCCTLPIRK